MAGKWDDYWAMQTTSIQQGILQWRRSGFARQPIDGLSAVTDRQDLYSSCTVTTHGPSSGVSGKHHMFVLAKLVAPLLGSAETVRVSLCRDGGDFLEFSTP